MGETGTARKSELYDETQDTTDGEAGRHFGEELAHAPRREARHDNEQLVHLEISNLSKDLCERGG